MFKSAKSEDDSKKVYDYLTMNDMRVSAPTAPLTKKSLLVTEKSFLMEGTLFLLTLLKLSGSMTRHGSRRPENAAHEAWQKLGEISTVKVNASFVNEVNAMLYKYGITVGRS